MKTFMSMVMVFFLVLAVVPAMAADQAGSDREPVTAPALDQAPLTFQAFSSLPATEREALTPLTDTELAVIEGSAIFVSPASTLPSSTRRTLRLRLGLELGYLVMVLVLVPWASKSTRHWQDRASIKLRYFQLEGFGLGKV